MANLSTLFGGGIKNIQTGVITFSGGSATATATITGVVIGKAFLLNGGVVVNASGGTLDNNSIELVLTNSTTVTATRVGTTGAPQVSWTVVEYF